MKNSWTDGVRNLVRIKNKATMTMTPKIWQFDKEFMKRHAPVIGEYVQSSYANKILTWIIDAKYRKAVWLSNWIKEQVDNPSGRVVELAKAINTGADDDETIINILRVVHGYLLYVGDPEAWKMSDYWQTGKETLTLRTGDCEDGAILIYLLARAKGISATKLQLWCGSVTVGGHCVLMYRPMAYPLNWVMIDWCYWYDDRGVDERNMYYVDGNTMFGFQRNGKIDGNYLRMWFCFNEEKSFTELRYNVWK